MTAEQRPWDEAATELLRAKRLPELTPVGAMDAVLETRLDELAAGLDAFGQRRSAAAAVLAGLYLMNGSLDKSHELSQDIHSATGSYWHGIMHRMEPDYWNAKYWFRKVGTHRVFKELPALAAPVAARAGGMAGPSNEAQRLIARLGGSGSWDPYIWTDAVELQEQGRGGTALSPLMKELQWLECEALLRDSYRECFGDWPGQ